MARRNRSTRQVQSSKRGRTIRTREQLITAFREKVEQPAPTSGTLRLVVNNGRTA